MLKPISAYIAHPCSPQCKYEMFKAFSAAILVPATPLGGLEKCKIGSATL